jgi:hypothetical protein
LEVIGKCIIQLQSKNYEFFVTDTGQHPLLGFKASNDLGLIQLSDEGVDLDVKAIGFPSCSKTAPKPEFDASQLTVMGFDTSKNLKTGSFVKMFFIFLLFCLD